MTEVSLPRDNLFQLNALIWATFPQPADAPWTPALLNAGYELWAVEQPLDAGVAELAAISSSNLEIQPNPVADVVFHKQSNDRYILTECKPASFGAGSGHSPQARGLIVAGANLRGRLASGPSSSGEVCYVVPTEDTVAMDGALLTISEEVVSQGMSTCDTGAVGLSVRADGIYIGLAAEPQGHAEMPRALMPELKIASLEAGQDPRPLYVIPWIPDAPDDGDLTAFREKIRAQTLAWLGRIPLGTEQVLGFDQLLDEVSRGIYTFWRDRDTLRGRVFPTVRRLLNAFLQTDSRVRLRERDVSVAVTLASEGDREELMERVRTTQLPAKLPEGVQLQLEDAP